MVCCTHAVSTSSQNVSPLHVTSFKNLFSDRVTGKKVFVVAILLAVNLLNYMDRFTIAGVLGRLQDYFFLNDKESGVIQVAALTSPVSLFVFCFALQTVFVVFFMIFAPICGYLGDRYNRKHIITCGLAVWIIGVILSTLLGRTVRLEQEHSKVFLSSSGPDCTVRLYMSCRRYRPCHPLREAEL